MKTVAAAILLLFFTSAALTGWRILSRSDTLVVGGQYTLPAGRVIHSNLKVFFAQVHIPDGARVDGQITAVSSTLELAGSVGGSVLAVSSDVTVRTTAQLAEPPHHVSGIPYVVLLPSMLRTGSPQMAR